MFTRKPITVAPSDTLAKAARLMQEHHIGAVVVAEQYRPTGIITDRDIALAVCVHGAAPKAKVASAMTAPVATIHEDEGVLDATQKMMDQHVRRLPIVDENEHLVGLVSIDDLLPLVSRELSNMVGTIHAGVAS
jgi:CBS domain-containing protein